MNKVLFIAYDFPPCKGVGGSLRSEKFVQYLKDYGWESTVISVQSKNVIDHKEIFTNVLRFKSLTPFNKPFHITPYGWALNICFKLKSIPRDRFDLVYVSCPPFPYLMSAIFLKKRFSIPLVVDFRDAWLFDPYSKNSFINKWIYKNIVPQLEQWVVKSSDCLILNTPSVYDAYTKRYSEHVSRMKLLPNGFDDGDFLGKSIESNQSGCIRLLYCGRFGVAGRNPELLLSAIKKAREKDMKIKLSIMGSQPKSVSCYIDSQGLQNYIELIDEVKHSEAIAAMLQHDVLVVFQQFSAAETQAIAGKTYEYLRTGKPILSIAPAGDNQNVIAQYANRYELVSDYKVESVYSAIDRLYQDWKSAKLNNSNSIDKNYLINYERKKLTQQLAGIFESFFNV